MLNWITKPTRKPPHPVVWAPFPEHEGLPKSSKETSTSSHKHHKKYPKTFHKKSKLHTHTHTTIGHYKGKVGAHKNSDLKEWAVNLNTYPILTITKAGWFVCPPILGYHSDQATLLELVVKTINWLGALKACSQLTRKHINT